MGPDVYIALDARLAMIGRGTHANYNVFRKAMSANVVDLVLLL